MDQVAERRQSLAAVDAINFKNGTIKRGSILKVLYTNTINVLDVFFPFSDTGMLGKKSELSDLLINY